MTLLLSSHYYRSVQLNRPHMSPLSATLQLVARWRKGKSPAQSGAFNVLTLSTPDSGGEGLRSFYENRARKNKTQRQTDKKTQKPASSSSCMLCPPSFSQFGRDGLGMPRRTKHVIPWRRRLGTGVRTSSSCGRTKISRGFARESRIRATRKRPGGRSRRRVDTSYYHTRVLLRFCVSATARIV